MKIFNSFSDYSSTSFSYFRFFFYFTNLIYFTLYNNIFSDWRVVDPNFWEPISFFYVFSYTALISIDPNVLRWIFIVSMALCMFGLFFRFSSVIAFFIFLFAAGFPCNFGKIHHSNHMTAVLLGLLCFVPSGRVSLDTLFKKNPVRSFDEDTAWRWFFFTAIAYMSIVYGFAGAQKLRNTGLNWFSNESMATIILTRPTVTAFGLWVASSDWLCGCLAKFALVLELMAPLALFLKNPWRFFYGFLLFMLHQGMYWTLGDHGAFFPYQICFLAWLPWPQIHSTAANVFRSLTTVGVQEKYR